MSALGRTVRLFLVDGNSQAGMVTAEIINWTGRVLSAPRSRLVDVLRREEASRTGIYILFGDAFESGVRRDVYIGESDNVGRRVLQHSRDENKDFFDRFCIVTSSDLNLTKTQARYVESRLTAIARLSGRANVLNANEPPEGRVPESDVADMEYFIEQLKIVLPVLGFDILRDSISSYPTSETIAKSGVETSDIKGLELFMPKNRDGIEAWAVLIGDEVIVRSGSLARRDPEYAVNVYSGLRDQLIADGALVPSGSGVFLEFSRDVPFASPSAASAVILGRNDNGRRSWRVERASQSLRDYQNSIADIAEFETEGVAS